MAVCWLLCLAIFSYPLSAERVAHKRILHGADSFLTRGHGAREFAQETSNGTRTEAKVGLPKCSDGILQLDGVYEVKKEVLVEGPSCRVTGSAELLLWAPLRFQGNLVFAGQLNVKAAGDGGRVNASCITIEGNFTSHPEARLSIQGCKNEADGGDARHGGCLHIGGNAELLGAQLLLRECSARKAWGGGMYVAGRLQSRNATIDAEGCDAKHGGAFYAEMDMHVSGGSVTIRESTAHAYGGAIHARQMDVSGGSVNITESRASQGGAIHAPRAIHVSGGKVTITKSHASFQGGAVYAENMHVSGGNVTITESTAMSGGAVYAENMNVSGGGVSITESRASRGGAIHAKRNMDVSGGGVSITESRASQYGGAIAATDMNVSGGNVTITASTAQENGGAISAGEMDVSGGNITITKSKSSKGGAIAATKMDVSGGSVSIRESTADKDGGCIYTMYDFTQSGGAVSFEGCKARREGGGIFSRGNIQKRR